MESNTEGNITNTSKSDGSELEVKQLHCWEELSLVVPLSHSRAPCSACLCSAEVFRQNQLLTEVVNLKRLKKLFFFSSFMGRKEKQPTINKRKKISPFWVYLEEPKLITS